MRWSLCANDSRMYRWEAGRPSARLAISIYSTWHFEATVSQTVSADLIQHQKGRLLLIYHLLLYSGWS